MADKVGGAPVVPGTHCREGEAGHNVYLEGTMGDTPGSQTVSMKLQRIAHLGQQKLCAKRESYLFG